MKPNFVFRFFRSKLVNIICSVVLATIVLATSIYSRTRLDSITDKMELSIIQVDNTVAWVCLILYITLVFNVKNANEGMLLFHVMVYMTAVASDIDAICFTIDHHVDLTAINYVMNNCSFIILTLLAFTYWWTLMAELGFNTKGKRVFSNVLVVIIIIEFIMIFVSNFTGWYFTIDNGNYVDGPIYLLSLLPYIAIMIASIIATIRTKNALSDKIVMILFPIAPLIYAITRLFGSNEIFLYLTILFTQLLIYGFIYTKRGAELEEDFLTGANSAASYHKLMNDVDKKILSGMVEPFAIVEFDLNNLKRINDSFGHEEGNNYIRNCYKEIKAYFKNSKIYRFGGDEFVAYCTGEDCENVYSILSMIHSKMEERVSPVLNLEVFFASGYSEYRPKEDKSLQDVFVRADEEMYKNKVSLKEKL